MEPINYQQPQQPTPQPEKPKRKFYKRWWFWALILLSFLGLIIILITINNPSSKLGGWNQRRKCETQEGRYWHSTLFICYQQSVDAGQVCREGGDCSTGNCLAGFVPVGLAWDDYDHDKEGFLLGKCQSYTTIYKINKEEEISGMISPSFCNIIKAGQQLSGRDTAVLECIDSLTDQPFYINK